MRVLHTSDWHLGSSLAGKKRYDEEEAFLNWLISIIDRECIETLIVAGDIFDSGTPSNRALELYYRFLGRAGKTCCRHILITAGNHDSPTLLTAPQELLSALDIHVVGSIPLAAEDEVFIFTNIDNEPDLVVCAVPFLRDRDIRTAEAGESIEEKRCRLLAGIGNHYTQVCGIAELHRERLGKNLPILATGHLFAAGGCTVADDGVRDLAVGNLMQVSTSAFPACIDYLALGHLHQPQIVGGEPSRRYSGSPFMMGFGESDRCKEVLIVDISPEMPVYVTPVIVPRFRDLVQIHGDANYIRDKLGELIFSGRPAWLEILLEDTGAGPSVRDELYRIAEGSAIEVLKVKLIDPDTGTITSSHDQESLEELSPDEVFKRCLDEANEPEENREELIAAYHEVLAEIQEGD
ncbi:MAG TPA: exonuclease SbcCD subunit D C-terminal domain-containing protein [Methanospirillum sp.]|uniref:exonuclease SbcCD subunit D C-terminal domain-containing protein n=1 Tax=Methanospirillum sp. TaxID=45200 RepID=UPI002CF17557|nr:exonuclease SbcCD subunit D C-terminal domain-containing protein [Methanospirillum sp.]HWQ64254.1 exonuclease SbcCD subunit D C-terminal domain-containing protein [Methanospirillum sp.]